MSPLLATFCSYWKGNVENDQRLVQYFILLFFFDILVHVLSTHVISSFLWNCFGCLSLVFIYLFIKEPVLSLILVWLLVNVILPYNQDVVINVDTGLLRYKQAEWTIYFAKWSYGCHDIYILPPYTKGIIVTRLFFVFCLGFRRLQRAFQVSSILYILKRETNWNL